MCFILAISEKKTGIKGLKLCLYKASKGNLAITTYILSVVCNDWVSSAVSIHISFFMYLTFQMPFVFRVAMSELHFSRR